jgi:hypothetical protein
LKAALQLVGRHRRDAQQAGRRLEKPLRDPQHPHRKGRIDFDDRPAKQKHVIAELDLGVPFVSNLPSQVETFVEPLLAMKVNDTPFEIHGKARPFSPIRESRGQSQVRRLRPDPLRGLPAGGKNLPPARAHGFRPTWSCRLPSRAGGPRA